MWSHIFIKKGGHVEKVPNSNAHSVNLWLNNSTF